MKEVEAMGAMTDTRDKIDEAAKDNAESWRINPVTSLCSRSRASAAAHVGRRSADSTAAARAIGAEFRRRGNLRLEVFGRWRQRGNSLT